MAIVKIHNIKWTLKKALAYIMNPSKTEGQLLVSGYNCDPQTAYFDFELTNTMARTIKGDYSKGGCNIAHHIVQSFAPYDKITPEQAHAIGKEFADRFLQGRYEYVIATHVDKGHIHNHIIFNAVSFYDYKKFRNYKVAAKAREISDRLCVENGLYVPQFKRQKAVKHHEWSQRKNGTSWVAQLEEILNKAVTQARNFSEFCELVRSMNVEIGNPTPDDGKHIKFKYQDHRFCRGYNLKGPFGDFSRDNIIAAIDENNREKPLVKKSYLEKLEEMSYGQELRQVKKLAQSLRTIRAVGIEQESDFTERVRKCDDKIEILQQDISKLEQKNAEYKKVARILITYDKNLPIKQEADKKLFGKRAFVQLHQTELEAFEYAEREITRLGLSKTIDTDKVIEKIKQQDEEIRQLHLQVKAAAKLSAEIQSAHEVVKELNGRKTDTAIEPHRS